MMPWMCILDGCWVVEDKDQKSSIDGAGDMNSLSSILKTSV